MNFEQYIQACKKTESVLPQTTRVDKQALYKTLNQFVLSSELLDGLKKRLFYNRTHDRRGNPMGEILTKTAQSLLDASDDLVADRCTYVPDEEISVDLRYLHGVIGLATESGELVDALYKSLSANEIVDPVNVLEELGDVFWYVSIIVDALRLNFNEILERNTAKLKARYGDKFSDERANERDLETERVILENVAKATRLDSLTQDQFDVIRGNVTEGSILRGSQNPDVFPVQWCGTVPGDIGDSIAKLPEICKPENWPENIDERRIPFVEFVTDLTSNLNQDALDEVDLLSQFEESVQRALLTCDLDNDESAFYGRISAAYDLLEAAREPV